ncbi:phytanoyl-CoA dioxygenase family protein [Dactylosporangium sp. NPDC049525]|uniref:phytanoyl-CoA dioxygenase family protein n=1 Tax=Dactylosporangium sp. NPDC049525 TaxID=3154730 RepID=UPI00343E130A
MVARPGGHHIDGLVGVAPGGVPDSFSLLVGVMLTDQRREGMGNLYVWPGTHLTHQEYFRAQGPDAITACDSTPPIRLGRAEQVTGTPGDVLLAHYLLAHNIGGNTSEITRRMVYLRLRHRDHDWRAFLADVLLDFEPVRVRRPSG